MGPPLPAPSLALTQSSRNVVGVDYADVVAASFNPSPEGSVAAPTIDPSPARGLRDAIEPIAMHVVWARATNERLATLGLDFLTGYVWGRAAALGEPDAGVVAATFAVFEPAFVGAMYDAGRRACDRETMLAARSEATIASLTEALGDADVASVSEVLASAVAAVDGTGRPLFSGLRAQAWPDAPVGRLWRACELVREHRGDSHVAACIARGLGPIEMNILTELWVGMPLGAYTATRGWAPDSIAAAAEALRARGLLEADDLSPNGRALRNDIEATTDAMQAPLLDALGADLEAMVALLTEWSERCIAAGAFPPDVFKRAAG